MMYEELVTNLRNCAELNSLSYYKRELMKQAADAIEKLSKSRWIPVTERLPEENDDVLIYGEWTGVSSTKYREIWMTDLRGFLNQGYKPIAWMPLPPPMEVDG